MNSKLKEGEKCEACGGTGKEGGRSAPGWLLQSRPDCKVCSGNGTAGGKPYEKYPKQMESELKEGPHDPMKVFAIGDSVKIDKPGTNMHKRTGKVVSVKPASLTGLASYGIRLQGEKYSSFANASQMKGTGFSLDQKIPDEKHFKGRNYKGKKIGEGALTVGDRVIFIDVEDSVSAGPSRMNKLKGTIKKLDYGNLAKVLFDGRKKLSTVNLNRLQKIAKTKANEGKITEGSYRGDLQRLITPELHIDQHRSKMGEDDDVIVVSFKIRGKEPSKDLVAFLETGYDFILDADASPGEISPGKFLVFFELSRRTTAPERIYQIVEEVLNLSLQKMDEWRFAYGAPAQRGTRRKFTTYPLTLENLKSKIPMSPREYRDSHEEPQDSDDIAAMKTIAQLPVNQAAPDDDEMNTLRQAAGTL